MIGVDVGFTLNDAEARAPDPLLCNARACTSEYDEHAAGCVDDDSVLPHPVQNVGVDEVARAGISTRRKGKEDIARVRELVRVGQVDGAHVETRGKSSFESGVAGRGWLEV